MTPQQAAKYLLNLTEAEDSYLGFVKLIHPKFKLTPFQLEIIDTLDKLEKGTLVGPTGNPIRSVLMTMPPRHAKSTFCTIGFPAYYLARDPARFVLSTSYNATLAADFGRQCRDLSKSAEVQQAFPRFKISSDSRAADVWRTEEGGAYFGVGIGGTTTGRPSNLLLIDDPLKSREEAESITLRNKVGNFYTSGLQTRKQPDLDGNDPIEIVVLTRWHPDDLAGRIMDSEDWKEGRWHHLDYKAINKVKGKKIARVHLPANHPMKLEPNEMSKLTRSKRYVQEETEVALWPERFPLELLKRRQRADPREFEALYQQQPYIEGGNILKTSWWNYLLEQTPLDAYQTIISVADTAFKKDESNDPSVILTGGITHSGDIHIIRVDRGRWEYPELKQRLITNTAMYRHSGLRGLYIEDKASGQSLIQELRRESGLAVIPYKVGKDKVSRTHAVTPLIEGGRVFLPPEADWLDAFVEECAAFPSGKHDDQVDALTMFLDIISRMGTASFTNFGDLNPANSINAMMGNNKNPFSSDFKTENFKGWGE